MTSVPPGTCGDFDCDGRIDVAEDTDNATDRIFGTINAALAGANGGANQNGRVTIVTSGRFPEVVNITAANGNVTLEGRPAWRLISTRCSRGTPIVWRGREHRGSSSMRRTIAGW